MRYGQIITTGFYGIRLIPKSVELIDGHFLGAAHHRYRSIHAQNFKDKLYHARLYWRHVQAMHKTIASGDFKNVFKHPSVIKGGFFHPSGWLRVTAVPFYSVEEVKKYDSFLSSPTLFQHMAADSRHGVGQSFPYDLLLENPYIRTSDISLQTFAA